MDFTIPIGRRNHSKEAMEIVKGREEKYVWNKKLLGHVQKCCEKHANKTWKHVEFEVEQHVWLNIWDFKMSNKLAPSFITKYMGFYETLHKPHYCNLSLGLMTKARACESVGQ
jgi:hypothetical protein